MDFFDWQIQAKRRTRFFLFLYGVTFVVATLALYVLVSFFPHSVGQLFYRWSRHFWDWELLGWVALGTGCFVVITVLQRYLQLRRGGPAVAEMLRGEVLAETTADSGERQLHNVVEEMSIASGIPKPAIYIFEREQGINALAAGFGLDDAVIGVTRGALMHLNRDELQGVVAHEFSHILNGDMRLSLWMICFLHSFFSVHEYGVMALRSSWDDESNTINWRFRRDGGIIGTIGSVIVGMALIIIGYTGYMMARMVQCALARQRECLADAAAVQFTRNPNGLAGALKKVGGWSRHGLVDHPFAEEAGHVFFVDGVGGMVEPFFSTHPSLENRIRLLDSSFDGDFPVILDERALRRSTVIRVPDVEWPAPTLKEELGMDRVQAQAIVGAIGQLGGSQLERSRILLENMPAILREAVRTIPGAEAAVLLLLAPGGEATLRDLKGVLGEPLDPETREAAVAMGAPMATASREMKLALVELSLVALHGLSVERYETFRRQVEALSEGAEPSLYRICIQQIVTNHLDRYFGKSGRAAREVYSIGTMWEEIAVLLSVLARAGEKDPAFAWETSMFVLPPAFRGKALPEPASVAEVKAAMEKLHGLSPGIMRRVMTAAVHAVASDGQVAPEEAELLRAIAAALGCPAPPAILGSSLPNSPGVSR